MKGQVHTHPTHFLWLSLWFTPQVLSPHHSLIDEQDSLCHQHPGTTAPLISSKNKKEGSPPTNLLLPYATKWVS